METEPPSDLLGRQFSWPMDEWVRLPGTSKWGYVTVIYTAVVIDEFHGDRWFVWHGYPWSEVHCYPTIPRSGRIIRPWIEDYERLHP